jgi:hypothetical protein
MSHVRLTAISLPAETLCRVRAIDLTQGGTMRFSKTVPAVRAKAADDSNSNTNSGRRRRRRRRRRRNRSSNTNT